MGYIGGMPYAAMHHGSSPAGQAEAGFVLCRQVGMSGNVQGCNVSCHFHDANYLCMLAVLAAQG